MTGRYLNDVSAEELGESNAQEFTHFFVEKAFTRTIRLDPFAINDELGNGALAGAADDLFGSAGSGFDIDFLVGDLVSGQEAFGLAALGAPEG
jgi:hypothetical protein